MIQSPVEIVTAITITLIIAIVAIYLIILKKNGWIGETSNYRCPNPQCKKIFQSPMKVKDFSHKKVTHLACPECGYDLDSSTNEKTSKDTAFEIEPKPKPKESTAAVSKNIVFKTIKENKQTETVKTSPITEPKQDKIPQKANDNTLKEHVLETQKTVDPNNSASTSIENEVMSNKIPDGAIMKGKSKENKSHQETNSKEIVVEKRDNPTGCNHNFGYLGTLQKGKQTPEECYACTELIECLRENKN